MAQCCDTFTQSTIPTDTLISPLIKMCELASRVNDYFSYDDIENADVNGELMLEMSTSNFRRELALLKETTSKIPATNGNGMLSLEVLKRSNQLIVSPATIKLMLCLLDIWIHECCLHGSLWQTSSKPEPTPPSVVRLKMLLCALNASKSYLETILQLSEQLLYQMALQCWTGWFYAVIVICKIVFLEDNERLGHTQFDSIPQEIDGLIPEILGHGNAQSEQSILPDPNKASNWLPLSVARDYHIQRLFERFMNLLSFTLPPECAPWTLPRDKRDSLHAIACIQHTMLHGFTKRIQRLALPNQSHGSSDLHGEYNDSQQTDVDSSAKSVLNPSTTMKVPYSWPNEKITHPTVRSTLPFMDFMNFDSLNFQGVVLPESFPTQPNGFDDWIWDSVMDDFTMPSL